MHDKLTIAIKISQRVQKEKKQMGYIYTSLPLTAL